VIDYDGGKIIHDQYLFYTKKKKKEGRKPMCSRNPVHFFLALENPFPSFILFYFIFVMSDPCSLKYLYFHLKIYFSHILIFIN
jgi:hypothetical protein